MVDDHLVPQRHVVDAPVSPDKLRRIVTNEARLQRRVCDHTTLHLPAGMPSGNIATLLQILRRPGRLPSVLCHERGGVENETNTEVWRERQGRDAVETNRCCRAGAEHVQALPDKKY